MLDRGASRTLRASTPSRARNLTWPGAGSLGGEQTRSPRRFRPAVNPRSTRAKGQTGRRRPGRSRLRRSFGVGGQVKPEPPRLKPPSSGKLKPGDSELPAASWPVRQLRLRGSSGHGAVTRSEAASDTRLSRFSAVPSSAAPTGCVDPPGPEQQPIKGRDVGPKPRLSAAHSPRPKGLQPSFSGGTSLRGAKAMPWTLQKRTALKKTGRHPERPALRSDRAHRRDGVVRFQGRSPTGCRWQTGRLPRQMAGAPGSQITLTPPLPCLTIQIAGLGPRPRRSQRIVLLTASWGNYQGLVSRHTRPAAYSPEAGGRIGARHPEAFSPSASGPPLWGASYPGVQQLGANPPGSRLPVALPKGHGQFHQSLQAGERDVGAPGQDCIRRLTGAGPFELA